MGLLVGSAIPIPHLPRLLATVTCLVACASQVARPTPGVPVVPQSEPEAAAGDAGAPHRERAERDGAVDPATPTEPTAGPTYIDGSWAPSVIARRQLLMGDSFWITARLVWLSKCGPCRAAPKRKCSACPPTHLLLEDDPRPTDGPGALGGDFRHTFPVIPPRGGLDVKALTGKRLAFGCRVVARNQLRVRCDVIEPADTSPTAPLRPPVPPEAAPADATSDL